MGEEQEDLVSPQRSTSLAQPDYEDEKDDFEDEKNNNCDDKEGEDYMKTKTKR